jgi:TonB family protein
VKDFTLGWATLGLATLFALSATSCASSSATHPSAVDPAAAERQWSSRVRAQVRDYWNPWDVVKAARSTESPPNRPTTVLRLAIKPDGTAPQPEILRSSGVSALDDAAGKAIVAALPLPAPPPELLKGASSLPFDLGFRVVLDADPAVPPEDDERDPFAVISANCEYKTPGTINPSEIQRTVEAYRRDMVVCLDRQRIDGVVDLFGTVTVEFVIAESGNVFHPVVVNTYGGLTRSLEGCLVKAMYLWTFPKPTGGTVKVAFPFHFGTGRASGADVRASQGGKDLPLGP